MRNRALGHALRMALFGGTAMAGGLISLQANAQQTAEAKVEEVVVTGTRIKSDITGLNPLTVISAESIAQTKAVNLENVLNKDPALDFASSGINQNANNGGFGASTVSLHALGPQRTLVLLNGERFPFTDTQGSSAAVDLNNIPVSMIERIEVLKNGASSVYGADAVAGVINVILKKNFNGFQVDGMVGTTDKGDGTTHAESVTMGMNNDKGNLLLNVSYNHRDPVYQRDRAWSSDLHLADFPGGAPSSGRPPGLRLVGAPAGYGFKSYYGGTFDNLLVPGTTRFNLAPTPYLTGELEQRQINLVGQYNLSDNITAVADAFYTNRKSQELLNPEPIDFATTTQKYPAGFTLPANSPLNPSPVDIAARTRRFEGGPRVYTDDINTYRFHVGLDGTAWDNYDWHVGYIYGESNATNRVKGEVNFTHFFQLAGIVPCGLDVIYGCHVADGKNGHGNLFSDNGLTSQEVNYFQFINTRTSGYTLDYYYARIGGPVPGVNLPGGPLRFAAGLERRHEASFDNPDSVVVAGDANADAAPTKGSYHVLSEYVDVLAPLFKDAAFAKAFDVEGSFRHDDYNIYGSANTWRVSGDWAPVEDIRFRGTRSTAFRAPQVKELFGGLYQSANNATDPCSTGGIGGAGDAARNGACSAALTALGVNPNTYQSSQTQINTINGGNVNLKPEKAKEYTIGTVITPRFVPGFSFSADYYNIDIENYIQAFGTQDVLEACYLRNVASACQNITRQRGTGEVVNVLSSNINYGYQKTAGIDFQMGYATDIDKLGINRKGQITVDLRATRELHDRVSGSASVNEQVGTWQGPPATIFEPKWRGLLSLTYSEEPWSFNWTGTYHGPVTQLLGAPGTPGNDAGSVVYHDIAFTYDYKNYRMVLGVNNLFDKDPPFLNDAATNSLGAGYDYTGRFIFIRLSAKL